MKTLTEILPILAKELSKENYFNKIILYLRLAFFAIVTKIFMKVFPVHFSFVYKKVPIAMTLHTLTDIGALKEIFIDKEYENFPDSDVNTIVDLGAHFGDTALYYHACFPDAKIYAVEPSPESYARLVRHTEKIENIIPIHAAIGDKNGKIPLHIMPSSLGNSLKNREGSVDVVMVSQLTLPALYEKYSIQHADILKFDIEGAEFSAFKEIPIDTMATMCIGEVHEDLGDATVDSFEEMFSAYSTVETDPLPKKGRYSFTAYN